MDDFYIRKAKVQDVRIIHALLMECARKGELLPRSFNDLYHCVRDIFVLSPRASGHVVGCCALTITWEDLAEVRSLIVSGQARGEGWGRRLVEACLSEAVTLGIYRVFTLTYQVDFFKRLGFAEIAKDQLPQKVWADCIHCVKFPECDEVAMIIDM